MELTTVSVDTVSGSGQAVTRLDGLIYGVLITYDAAAPATTTVTIAELEGAQRQIIQIASNNTDYQFVPQIPGVGADNTSLSVYSLVPVTGERLAVNVTSGGTIPDAVTVWFWTE